MMKWLTGAQIADDQTRVVVEGILQHRQATAPWTFGRSALSGASAA